MTCNWPIFHVLIQAMAEQGHNKIISSPSVHMIMKLKIHGFMNLKKSEFENSNFGFLEFENSEFETSEFENLELKIWTFRI